MFRRTSCLLINQLHNELIPKVYPKSCPQSLLWISLRRFSQQRRRHTNKKKTNAPKTTKDRLRRLLETNQTAKPSIVSTKQVNKLLELAQGRLGYLRTKLYEHWNPDYLKEQNQKRPVKKGPIMDFRWWFWNVLFALLPAIIIGVYCEFRGQYQMHQFHQRQELQQMERVMGEEYVQQHLDELTVPPPQNFVVRVWNILQEVTMLIQGLVVGEQVNQNHEPVVSAPVESSRQQKETRQLSSPQSTKEVAISQTSNDPSLQALLDRIQKLEQKVEQQDRDKQRMLEFQRNRVQQSGIQNRMEDSMIESWKQRIANKQASATTISTPEHESAATSQTKDSTEQQSSISSIESIQNAMRTTIESIIPSLRQGDAAEKDDSSGTLPPEPTTRVERSVDDAASTEKADRQSSTRQSTVARQPVKVEETRTVSSKEKSSSSMPKDEEERKRWWSW